MLTVNFKSTKIKDLKINKRNQFTLKMWVNGYFCILRIYLYIVINVRQIYVFFFKY